MADRFMQGVMNHSRLMQQFCKERVKYHFVTSLYGSQNYGTAGPNSDIDTHTIILPNMAEILLEHTKDTGTHTLPNNEQATYKDLHSMFEMYRKSNVNFLETLFTPWYDCNPQFADDWNQLRAGGELIATYNKYGMFRTLKGYYHEQINNYIKEHSYKGLANAERLFYMMFYYFVEGSSYAEALQFGNNKALQDSNKALKYGQSFSTSKEETAYQVELENSMEKLCDKVEKLFSPGINSTANDFLNKMEAQLKLKVLSIEINKSKPQFESYRDGPRGIKTY